MKLLVATTNGQGGRSNDFAYTEEGEILFFPFACDDDGIDGACGCRRSMAGLHSGRMTTTMTVAEVADLTVDGLKALLRERLTQDGWAARMTEADIAAIVDEDAAVLMQVGEDLPPGCIIERRGEVFQTRVTAPPAPTPRRRKTPR
jgi:hypothetical protein